MFQLLEAIEHMHSKDVFHRDIKVENILIRDNATIKICDFGHSLYVSDNAPINKFLNSYVGKKHGREAKKEFFNDVFSNKEKKQAKVVKVLKKTK